MVEEAVHARFPKSRELLTKVKELPHGFVRVVICALHRRRWAQNIGDERRMTNFLICHKFNEEAVLGCETSSDKFLDGELGQAIVEKV